MTMDSLNIMTACERRLSAEGEGAWDREVRALIGIAATHGITLRDEDLVYLDVHDLQTLRWRIEHRHGRQDLRGHAA